MIRTASIAAAVALGTLALALPAAADPENGLACALVSSAQIEKIFGLPNEKRRPVDKSPTAGNGGGNQQITVDGSDESICELLLYRTPPSPATLKTLVGSPFKSHVPAGIGFAQVITDVRDTTPPSNGHGWGGEHWNVSNYYATLIKVASGLRSRYGGGFISGGPTKYGGGNSYAIWIGNRDHAVGIWRVGDGTIQIEVNASGGTGPAKLLSLAYLVVYKFAPFAQS